VRSLVDNLKKCWKRRENNQWGKRKIQKKKKVREDNDRLMRVENFPSSHKCEKNQIFMAAVFVVLDNGKRERDTYVWDLPTWFSICIVFSLKRQCMKFSAYFNTLCLYQGLFVNNWKYITFFCLKIIIILNFFYFKLSIDFKLIWKMIQ
jgi:hypothetical protein